MKNKSTPNNMKTWPEPSGRVGFFTDLTLYVEALALAQENGVVTAALLQRELGQRMINMRIVLEQSELTVVDLLRELRGFNWVKPRNGSLVTGPYEITEEGSQALARSSHDRRAFRRLLTAKMQEVYVIPGWFVQRLWKINPVEQGEIIVPAPLSQWSPARRKWGNKAWDDVLRDQTLEVARVAREVSPHGFIILDTDWESAVMKAWQRLSELNPPRRKDLTSPLEESSYSPRRRLAIAMREAWVGLMLDKVPYGGSYPDFLGNLRPVYPRTFTIWCARLEALELLFYTDWHDRVPGRIVFPVSVFRQEAPSSRFEKLKEVENPNGDPLWLHQPKWDTIRVLFLTTLIQVHQQHATRTGTLYVSLSDIRDEVCRQLRISSLSFDAFLDRAVDDLPSDNYQWSVALETDIRQEQSRGAGLARRPVYYEGSPHTLIALAYLPNVSKTRTRSVL